MGLDLKIFYGKPEEVFDSLVDFNEVVASGDYDSYAKERDLKISHKLHFRYLSDTYMFKPGEILKDDGTPYFVFTPFYKKARVALNFKNIEEIKIQNHTLHATAYDGISKNGATLELDIKNIGFIMQKLDIKTPKEKLEEFSKLVDSYKENRDFLDKEVGSGLSVDLRFGTISTREVLRYMFSLKNSDTEPFIRQLIFRDFYAYLLFHLPTLEYKNYKHRFNGIENREKFELFCSGKTGVPLVDAGVRELLKTGNMHNRVRMVVSSFFTKDLLLPWQWGEAFFASHLMDFDKASNVLSWQWSAGTGVDPQPYFRVFNPYLQSKKFDKDAIYIKKHVSELLAVEPKWIHSEEYLFANDIKNYPKPMIKHKEVLVLVKECFGK